VQNFPHLLKFPYRTEVVSKKKISNYSENIKLPINYDILYKNLRENRNSILESVLYEIGIIEKTSVVDDFNLGYFSIYLDNLSLGSPGFSSETRSEFCKMTGYRTKEPLELCLKFEAEMRAQTKARHWKFIGTVA
jgi:hypothetical protein